jgi:hypothetical protein
MRENGTEVAATAVHMVLPPLTWKEFGKYCHRTAFRFPSQHVIMQHYTDFQLKIQNNLSHRCARCFLRAVCRPSTASGRAQEREREREREREKEGSRAESVGEAGMRKEAQAGYECASLSLSLSLSLVRSAFCCQCHRCCVFVKSCFSLEVCVCVCVCVSPNKT